MSLFSHVCGETNHKFEPRFHTIPPSDSIMMQIVGGEFWRSVDDPTSAELFEAASKKEYVHDVCKYCGKIVKQ